MPRRPLHTLIHHHHDFNCLGVRKILSLNLREWGLKSLFKVNTCSRNLELRCQNRERMQKSGGLQRGRKEPGFVPQRGCSLRVAALEEQGSSPLPLPWWDGATSCPGIFTLQGSVCNCSRGGSLVKQEWNRTFLSSLQTLAVWTVLLEGWQEVATVPVQVQTLMSNASSCQFGDFIGEPGLGRISDVIYLAKKRVKQPPVPRVTVWIRTERNSPGR